MVAEMIEKPLTEAQRLIARLEGEFGMAQAEIAQAIRVKPDTVFDIKRRKTTGNIQLRQLRRLITASESSGNPAESAGMQFPAFPVPDVPDFSDSAATITLNGEEPSPAPNKSLKERTGDLLGAMLGTTTVEAPKRTKAEASEQGELIEQLTPLAALLMVMSSSLMIPDPYKPCAPNMSEASAIALPIVKRAIRELDARKKLTEGTTDAIIILLAVATYGNRAWGTYKQIHAMEVERARSDNATATSSTSSTSPDGFGGLAAVPSAVDPARSARARGGASAHGAAPSPRRHDRGDGAQHGNQGSGDERRSNALLDSLLAADADGRKRLGLG